MNSMYLPLTFIVFAITCQIAISASTSETREFVDGHNSRRLQVAKGAIKSQPSASKMKKMMWDHLLYVKAFKYAATYPQNYSPVRTVLATSASTNEIREFVNGHNSRRLQVAKGAIYGQPSASEMKMMMWNHELYVKASNYAATYPQNHNPDKTVPSGTFTTGENLYWYSTTDRSYKLSPAKALDAWFIEHQNYTYGPINRRDFDGSKNYQIGHYTQMVWSNSIYVGCATSDRFEGQWKKFYVVCNYGPPGNYMNEKPYKKGGPSHSLVCGCVKNDPRCNCDKVYG